MNSAAIPENLQSTFVENLGAPIPFGDEEIVLGDRWNLDHPAVMEFRFVGAQPTEGHVIRVSLKKPGRIKLSNGQDVRVVEIADEVGLPRFARHPIDPKSGPVLIYNSYLVERGGQKFRESWTGNAGMIVTALSSNVRRYECSDGNGPFNRNNLIFEVEIMPSDTSWLPEEIYS